MLAVSASLCLLFKYALYCTEATILRFWASAFLYKFTSSFKTCSMRLIVYAYIINLFMYAENFNIHASVFIVELEYFVAVINNIISSNSYV